VIIDVVDGMFVISALGGGDLACPALDGLVWATGRPDMFITIRARDQSRPVRVESRAHASAPPWPEECDAVVEFSVHSPAGLLLEDPEGEKQRVLTRVGGDVRVRVRVDRVPPPRNQERPSETFTIEAWPASPAPTVAEDRAGREPEVEDRSHVRTTRPGDLVATAELEAAGRAAGNRIGELLDHPHGPQTGRCKLSVLVPGRRRRAFNRTAVIGYWLGGSSNWSQDEVAVGLVSRNCLYDPGNESALNGTTRNGHVQNDLVAIEPARRVVHHWNWYVPPGTLTSARYDRQVPLLDRPAVLELTFDEEPADDGTPWTRLTLTHTGLPVDWAPLMEDFWRWRCSLRPEQVSRR
jgi:hypothetical protein